MAERSFPASPMGEPGNEQKTFPARRHELKTWPEFFRAIRDGDKNFEVRKNDRAFQRGDVLWLREWNPSPGAGRSGYTGNDEYRTVTYVLTGEEWGIVTGYCVLGLSNEVADDDFCVFSGCRPARQT